ncbi:MAG: hypothetical protein C5B56_02050 [Proteobacteria bacterium]|nr:MAG: hypothetical protein C5B56_02050 [Pseudomonadota bacterium]
MSSLSIASGPMLHVSLIVEALRARPAMMFWAAALGQATLWTLVPGLFYGAPPGDLPLLLAVGHEWALGSVFGPPLASWLAEIAYRAAGSHPIGVYLLSQICVVLTFWAVFELGRAIVGVRHAAIAVLLMVGISALSLPTPEFGPGVLAMALTALSILWFWRAIAEDRRRDWYVLGATLGLLVLTSYAGLILVALIAVFTVATARGRAKLGGVDPWIAGMLLVLIVFPHLIWLDRSGATPLPELAKIAQQLMAESHLTEWLRLVAWLIAMHAGMLLLVIVVSGVGSPPQGPAPTIERAPPTAFARTFVYYFALTPAFVATLAGVLLSRPDLPGGAAPLVVLSGLALVLAAGDVIRLHHQRIIGVVWLALLVAPPLGAAGAIVVLPWIAAVDLEVNRPAAAMGQFFSDSFRRRFNNSPLEIVLGDGRLPAIVALASPDRPSLGLISTPEQTPWVTDADIRQKGAIVVWTAADASGAPPISVKARFPDLVVEVPRSFVRPVQGRLPVLRIGWAVIRPAEQK